MAASPIHPLLLAAMAEAREERARQQAETSELATDEPDEQDQLVAAIGDLLPKLDGLITMVAALQAGNQSLADAVTACQERLQALQTERQASEAQLRRELASERDLRLLAQAAVTHAEQRVIAAQQAFEAERTERQFLSLREPPAPVVMDKLPAPPKGWKVTVESRDPNQAVRKLRVEPSD